jgi:hypothetical protein
MVRRLLRFIIIYAVIAIAASAVFIGVQNVMARTYDPEPSDVFKDGEEPLRIDSLSEGFLSVIGRYTQGANAGMLFCKIYNRNGTFIIRHDFYLSDTAIEVSEVVNVDDGFRIVCICKPWDNTQPGFGAVFSIDSHWKADETVFFKPAGEHAAAGGFDTFVCADGEGEYYAGISGRNVTLFGRAGNVICNVMPDYFSKVTDVACVNNSVLLAGTDAESSLGNNFRYGLTAMYGISGGEATFRWQKTVMDEAGWCSAILNVETRDEGYTLTGRMLNVGGDNWQSINRLDSFRADDSPRRFHITGVTDNSSSSSLFILNMAQDGTITDSALYYTDSNEYIPAVMQYDRKSENNPFILSVYLAENERADRYSVNIMRMSRKLTLNDTFSLPVSGDTVFICAQDITGVGIYACVYLSGSGTYRILHFTSTDDSVNHMQTLLRLKPVRDYFFTLNKKAPVLMVLGFVLMLNVSGAGRVRKRHSKK